MQRSHLLDIWWSRAFWTVGFWLAIFAPIVSSIEKKDERLPHHFLPRHYTLQLLPEVLDESDHPAVHGFVQIDVKCIHTTRLIVLNALNIKVDFQSIKVYDRASRERFVVQNMTQDNLNHTLTLQIRRKSLVEGANYVIAMKFESRLNDQDHPRGFYRLMYTEATDAQRRVMALTQMQPTHARQVFPCFDEPNLKADFTIIVGRPVNMISVSNMPKYKTEPAKEYPGFEWDHFHRSFSMSTYLVSIAVLEGPSWLTTKNGNVTLGVWARPSLLNQTRLSLKVASDLMTTFQQYLEMEYPLPKQDMIAVPFSSTAMENWGLIVFGEQFLTYDDVVISNAAMEANVLVMSHEMAHQWFGNLVTLDWWSDIWLNEGLATYVSYVGIDLMYPENKIFQQFVLDEMQQVMYDDSLMTSHPVYQPVDTTDQALSVFDSISYKKGASLLRMLAGFIGEKPFRQGLKHYLQDMEYGNAIQQDFWAVMAKQAVIHQVYLPYDLKSIMETWTNRVGYPVVTISRNYSARTATAAQKRFLLLENNHLEESDIWAVPLTFTSANQVLFKNEKLVWLPPDSAETVINLSTDADEWVIFNVDRRGFYRVNYDERNWNLIWAQLIHDPEKIPTINRAQLIDDGFNLARASLHPYETAFTMVNYLKKETDYIPWKSAFDVFEYIDSMLDRVSTYERFKEFMVGLILPIYQNVTFFQSPEDELQIQRLRPEVVKWACHWGHTDCVNNSVVLFRRWMVSPEENVVSADLKRTVTCTAIRHLGLDEWQFAWIKYQQSNIHTEKIDLLSGLGCSTDPSLLSKLLERTIDPVNSDDGFFFEIISTVSSKSEAGRQLAFDYIRSNWEILKTKYGVVGSPFSKALESITRSFNRISDLEKLEQLKETYSRDDSDAFNLITYLCRMVESNVLWMSHHYPTIDQWLHQLRL